MHLLVTIVTNYIHVNLGYPLWTGDKALDLGLVGEPPRLLVSADWHIYSS